MIDLDKNVGKYLLILDFTGTGTSPAMKAVLPADAKPDDVVRAVSEGLRAVLAKHLGNYEVTLDRDPIGVQARPHSGIILPREERLRKSAEEMESLREIFNSPEARERETANEKAVDEHPMNGKLGWWRIEGIRNSCFARASSCREALEKSKDEVGSWESPHAAWIGEELPEVFS